MARKYRSRYLEAAERVHSDAIRAIRDGDSARYGEIADLYEELMMAFPLAWQEYGERFVPALAQGLDFLGPLHDLTQNLFEEMAIAIREDRRESAFTAIGVPFRIAVSAQEIGATALVKDMLRLHVEGYRLAEDADTKAAAEVKSTLTRQLLDFCKYIISPKVEDPTLGQEAQEQAAEVLRLTFTYITELLRTMLEGRGLSVLREFDSEWSDVLRFWEPGAYLGVEEEPKVNQQVELKTGLVKLRNLQRFGLAVWSLILYQRESDSTFLEAFRHFGGYFGSHSALLEVTEDALTDSTGAPWHDWILFARSERSGFLDTTGPALRTLLILMARRADPDSEIELPPEQWLHDARDRIFAKLDELAGETELAEAIGIDRWGDRLRQVRSMIETAAEEREQLIREDIAGTSVDRARVAQFREATRAAWANHRLGYSIHRTFGQLALDEGTAPDIVWGHSAWFPKRFFLTESQSTLHVEDIGRSVADGEMERWVDSLGELEPLPLDDELKVVVAREASRMREEGYAPEICITPTDWRLRRYFFDYLPPDPASAPEWMPEGARHWFAGHSLGFTFLNWPRTKADRIYIVDPARFSRYKAWRFDDGHELRVDVREFGQEEALDIANRKPEIMAEAGEDAADRAMEMRQHVYLDVRMKFDIEVVDSAAARAILLPPDLGRD